MFSRNGACAVRIFTNLHENNYSKIHYYYILNKFIPNDQSWQSGIFQYPYCYEAWHCCDRLLYASLQGKPRKERVIVDARASWMRVLVIVEILCRLCKTCWPRLQHITFDQLIERNPSFNFVFDPINFFFFSS